MTLRRQCYSTYRHHAAHIGIEKNNGIVMVDFPLEVERKEEESLVEATYQAFLLQVNSQILTPYMTPVIYVFLDSLAEKMKKLCSQKSDKVGSPTDSL